MLSGAARKMIVCLMVAGFACSSNNGTNVSTAPLAPSSLTGQAASPSKIVLSWNDNSNNEDGFIIFRGQLVWSEAARSGRNTTLYVDSLLQDSTAYSYYVLAYNGNGNSPTTDTITVTTLSIGNPPSEPHNPLPADGGAVRDLNIQLSWESFDPDDDSVLFDIHFGTSSPPPLIDSGRVQLIYDISGLTPGAAYYWQIVARDNHLHRVAGPIWSFNTLHTVNEIGRYHLPYYAFGIVVRNNYAYLANYASLAILDVASPSTPSLISLLNLPQGAYGIALDGNYAYVADDTSGLAIINIADPTHPVPVGNYNTAGLARAVFVESNYAYVACQDDGLVIVNVTDPSNPILASIYDTPGIAWNLFVAGNHAYIADDYDGGLQIINIADRANPAAEGRFLFYNAVRDVAVAGGYAFLANSYRGMYAADISNPVNPTFVSSVATDGDAQSIFVDGNRAYLAESFSDIEIMDIANPAVPRLVGAFDIQTTAQDIFAVGNYIYAATVDGLLILEYIP